MSFQLTMDPTQFYVETDNVEPDPTYRWDTPSQRVTTDPYNATRVNLNLGVRIRRQQIPISRVDIGITTSPPLSSNSNAYDFQIRREINPSNYEPLGILVLQLHHTAVNRVIYGMLMGGRISCDQVSNFLIEKFLVLRSLGGVSLNFVRMGAELYEYLRDISNSYYNYQFTPRTPVNHVNIEMRIATREESEESSFTSNMKDVLKNMLGIHISGDLQKSDLSIEVELTEASNGWKPPQVFAGSGDTIDLRD